LKLSTRLSNSGVGGAMIFEIGAGNSSNSRIVIIKARSTSLGSSGNSREVVVIAGSSDANVGGLILLTSRSSNLNSSGSLSLTSGDGNVDGGSIDIYSRNAVSGYSGLITISSESSKDTSSGSN